MASNKQDRPKKQETSRNSENGAVLSADDAMHRALNVKRPAQGWPWESKRSAKPAPKK
jgi:hypothetical protein